MRHFRDLTASKVRYTERDILAERLEALQSERTRLADDLAEARARLAEVELERDQARGQA